MSRRLKDEILPRPDRVHHMVEDFLTHWNAPSSHILPLRRFFETVLHMDLRQFYAEDCIEIALTHLTLPIFCQKDYVLGQSISIL